MKVESKAGAKGGRIARALAIMFAMTAVSFVLSGCAMSMLEGAARSGSGSSGSAPARPATSAPSDNAISTAVRSRFAGHSALKPLNLIVSTHDGVVTLRGQVNTVEQRNAAQLEARAVKGVRAVKNELTVR